MKISDIVKVKIESSLTYSSNAKEMNNTGAIIFIHTLTGGEVGTTINDATWVGSGSLGAGYYGKAQIDAAISTYVKNGGISLVVKRIYFASSTTDGEKIDEVDKAVYGGAGINTISHSELSIDVKNIQLGYSLPNRLIEKIHIANLRIYLAADNLITITKYQGFDPEIGGLGGYSYGLDVGTYPQPRTYRAGITMNF
jgi:hypothetical protein